MIQQPLFSLLIANYNNGHFLEECLQSVFAQTYENWEIILVDDGSKDDKSTAIYEKYQDHPKMKIYYNKENKGCGYTKRKCVEKANGVLCGFLDPDDSITENALEIMVETHIKNPGHSLIYSTHYLCEKDLSVVGINQSIKQVHSSGYFCSKSNNVSAFASFPLNSYHCTEGINPELKRAVDQDLYYKLDEVGSFLFINKPLYYYRRHINGISTAKNELKAIFWFQKVKEDTYKRRKKNNYPHNLIKKDINQGWFSYYIKKAYQKSRQHQYYKMYYLLYKSLQKGGLKRQQISIGIYPLRRYWRP